MILRALHDRLRASRGRQGGVLLSLALALVLPLTASARDPIEDRLDEIEASGKEVGESAKGLETQLAPGRGFITAAQAVERYQDYVYLHMIGDYEQAAEGFFTLVTTLALDDAGLHRDAEWYLAEALYKMGNVATAEARYQVIADDMQHPFRDDAVRRLLELYASSGQSEAFHAYYEQEILKGRVRPSDLITYSVGKAFYHQGQLAKAKKAFLEIGPDSPYARKSQYFFGALLVAEKDIGKALEVFRTLADQSVNTYEDRQILDLSLLALGRLHYEQGDFAKAAEYYGKIGGDSEYLADMLYEIAWTFIKQEQYKQALEGVDYFLLAYPEHQYAAQLRVLQGHLHMKENDHDRALDAYEQVIVDYTPIRERFGDLARSSEEPAAYFQRIVALDQGGAEAEGLPPFAVSMMMTDVELSRALTIYRELERQRRNIEISESIIAELEKVLGTSAGIGGFEQLRYDVLMNINKAIEMQLGLLKAEEEWLTAHLNEANRTKVKKLGEKRNGLLQRTAEDSRVREARRAQFKGQLDRLTAEAEKLDAQAAAMRDEAKKLREDLARNSALTAQERSEMERRLSTIDQEQLVLQARLNEIRDEQRLVVKESDLASDSESHTITEIRSLRKEFKSLREAANGEDKARVFARLDGLYTATDHDVSRLQNVLLKIDTSESAEMARIRAKVNQEVKAVLEQRRDLERTLVEAQQVSTDLTRAGFGRLEDFFAESVLKADMGIVDVYWAEKLDVADQKKRIQEEKAVLLSDLERRFDIIKQKLEQ